MRSLIGFLGLCLGPVFLIGCNLDDIGGSSGGSGGDGVAERSAYSIVVDWDGQVATLEDGFKIIVLDGTFQRESCSYGGAQNEEFYANVAPGQLMFYKVYISKDFRPGEPMAANQSTIVNLDCFKADPCTCGCASD